MRDYKELLEILRDDDFSDIICQAKDGSMLIFRTKQVAEIIESLIVERDALLNEIRNRCFMCIHDSVNSEEYPCCECNVVDGSKRSRWEWRGVKKQLDASIATLPEK